MATVRRLTDGEKKSLERLVRAKRKSLKLAQGQEDYVKLSNRNSSGFYEPWDPRWAQHHVLYPEQPKEVPEGEVEPSSPRPVYLHDYPLPAHEILHFFGFSLEDGTREIWKEEKRVLTEEEKELDRRYMIEALGTYTPQTRMITLYLPSIRDCAKHIGVDMEGLREVVRIHEYMHALHHLGAPGNARGGAWDSLTNSQDPAFLAECWALKETPTALEVFLASRDHWFGKLTGSCPTRRLEFVAQAGTAIYVDYLEAVYGPRPGSSPSLKEIFWKLMKEQPDAYRLDNDPKDDSFQRKSWPELGALFRTGLRHDWERAYRHAEEVFRKMRHYAIVVGNLRGEEASRAIDTYEALG